MKYSLRALLREVPKETLHGIEEKREGRVLEKFDACAHKSFYSSLG